MSKLDLTSTNKKAFSPDSATVPTTRLLTAGDGLTGGGNLSADRTFTLGTPTTLTTSTTNAVTATSHTHALSITAADVGGVPTTRTLTAGTGLSGGGDLSANRTFNLADTAATPGTYGDDGQFTSITVDAQGRITNIALGGLIAIDADQVATGTFGTASIANNAITDAKLRDSAALSVVGRSANSLGDPADIIATFDHQVLRRSGTSVGFGQVNLAQPAAVTGALVVANGGTGAATLTSGSYMQGNGTSAVTMRTPAQVWADIDNTALATVQTWTGAQTYTGISYHNGGMRVKTTDRTGGGTMTTSDYYVLVSGVAGITLPAAPADGQTLVLKEVAGFNCTVNRNGNNIDLVAANYTLPLDGSVRFVFRTGNGWFTFAA